MPYNSFAVKLYHFYQWVVAMGMMGAFQIFALHKIKFSGFSTSASVRPHKKAVKKIEAEGVKEKQWSYSLAMLLARKSY